MSKKQKEYRAISFNASTEENSRTISGLIPYNSDSAYMGFVERLSPGCFSKSLSEQSDIRALIEHSDQRLLARTKNGSLILEDGPDALRFTFDAPNTTEGDDILTMVRDGLVSGCSFGMIVMSENYTLENGEEIRTILEARLLEVSLVLSEPAYPETIVYTRSLSSAFEGKEISETDKTAIQEEINKLQNLLPKEEEKKEEEQKEPEPQKEPEGPTEEEIKAQEEQKQKDIEEQEAIDSLYKRLEEAEKILCEA